ncbi:MAG: anti-sigma factor [Vicinamibacterales bacterium]
MDHTTPDAPALTPAPADEPSSAIPAVPAAAEQTDAGESLAQLARRASEILERWSIAGERHERAVNQLESQLSEFEVTSARMQRDASQKMQELQRAIHGEWSSLREVHEEPIRQLREQANSLTEVCIATAHSAQRGFDQAEARLAAIELELQRRIADLRREVQTVVDEMRTTPGLARIGANPPAWPLDGVTRLHQQLRQSPDETPEPPRLEAPPLQAQVVVDPLPNSERTVPPPVVRPTVSTNASSVQSAPPSAADSELSERLLDLERALRERESEPRETPRRAPLPSLPTRRTTLILGTVAAMAVLFALWTQSRVGSRVASAEQSQQAATEETAALREQSAREVAAAKEQAARAEMVSGVLAAPDLIRFTLAPSDENSSATGQALWSRERGFVISASRLGPPPAGRTYQAWLLARGQAISAGTFEPDENGSVTFAVNVTPAPPPLISVVVSLEPDGGSRRPDGPPVLVRVRQ